jgi:enoyl-CoA hydratase/carnithine racemase
MDFNEIKYELNNKILTITLHRPEKLNAFTVEMKDELIEAFRRAEDDDDVRVIVVTGAGRGFCAGDDLSSGGFEDVSKSSATLEDHRDGGGLLTLKIYDVKKPMIAAINGPAVGIGITMTLPMDIRIASDNAKMGFVFTKRGIVLEACSSWFLPRIVGLPQSMEWSLTGRVFSAQEALKGGLVSRVVAQDSLMPTAYELAREIADHTSAISVALCRQLLWKMLGADHPMEAHRLDSKCVFYLAHSPDSVEGVASFLEKRSPHFEMKPSQDMPKFYPWWKERQFK